MSERLDAITVEVVNQSVAGIVQEMQNALFATGYSTVIRESHDASGAISVQISGEKRPAVAVPHARPVAPGSAAEIAAERAAFHSYYAYTGTWHFDESSSVCTHRVEVALLSVEEGMDYTQEVHREGDTLVFIRRGTQDGAPVIYRKVWQKI